MAMKVKRKITMTKLETEMEDIINMTIDLRKVKRKSMINNSTKRMKIWKKRAMEMKSNNKRLMTWKKVVVLIIKTTKKEVMLKKKLKEELLTLKILLKINSNKITKKSRL